MLEGVEKIFDNMEPMMKKLKKSSYEKNMDAFRQEHGHFFLEMTDCVERENDKEQTAKELAAAFVEKTRKRFEKKGKMPGRTQADLNFFMIYYTFPAILLTGSEYGRTVADAICQKWGECFKDSKIGYADYDSIYKGFREKIFGIF